ncbi:hypothetical protein OF83DRAFT_1177724 [Amylostereum chailletii]|nr:hypothetical protein OF83DRAFT_1177724 [Amylostereum chailletii]
MSARPNAHTNANATTRPTAHLTMNTHAHPAAHTSIHAVLPPTAQPGLTAHPRSTAHRGERPTTQPAPAPARNFRPRAVHSFEGRIFVGFNTLEPPTMPFEVLRAGPVDYSNLHQPLFALAGEATRWYVNQQPYLAFLPKIFRPRGDLLASLGYNARTLPLESDGKGLWRLELPVRDQWIQIECGVIALWRVCSQFTSRLYPLE